MGFPKATRFISFWKVQSKWFSGINECVLHLIFSSWQNYKTFLAADNFAVLDVDRTISYVKCPSMSFKICFKNCTVAPVEMIQSIWDLNYTGDFLKINEWSVCQSFLAKRFPRWVACDFHHWSLGGSKILTVDWRGKRKWIYEEYMYKAKRKKMSRMSEREQVGIGWRSWRNHGLEYFEMKSVVASLVAINLIWPLISQLFAFLIL